MIESDIEKYFLKRIKDLGGKTRKIEYIGRKGCPDRLVFLNGKIGVCELKRPNKKPRVEQYKELDLWLNNGAISGWCDTISTIDEFLLLFKR